MKLALKIILVILLIGGAFMSYGRFRNFEYEKYSSENPQLSITMDYLSGWRYTEHSGSYSSYIEVMFMEPKKEEGLRANMVVTVKKSSHVEFNPLTLEAMEKDLLAKRLKLKDAKVLSKSESRVLDTEAIDMQLAYKSLDKLNSKDAKLIPIKERIVILKRDDKFYTIRYMNREEAFAKFDRAFSHCLKTVRLKEE